MNQHPTPDRDPLGQVVAALDPVDDTELARRWHGSAASVQLLEDIVSGPGARVRPVSLRVPRTRRVVLAAAVLLTLSAAGVSAAGLFADREHDEDRMISPAQAEAEVARLGADVPLPPGGSFDLLAQELRGTDASQSEKGFAGMLAYNASCQWFAHWHDRFAAGDTAGATAALEGLRQIPSWKPYASVDGGAGGEGSTVAQHRRLTAAAEAGDVGSVREFLSINCGPSSGWNGPTRSPFGPGGG